MKRKLSDLKENECIKVDNMKQQIKLFKEVFKNTGLRISSIPKNCTHVYLFKNEVGFYWNTYKLDYHIEHPASDFIKPKKSKLKKVWQEIARLDKEVHDLKNADNKPELVLGLECETKELEVWKWYKCKYNGNKYLLGYCIEIINDNDFKGFGFDNKGEWKDYSIDRDSYVYSSSNWIEATYEEVESSLKNEAKKRGFYQGVKCKCLQLGSEVTLKGHFEWNGDALVYVDENDIYVIFNEGVWAEIIQENEIDWSLPRLAISKISDTIIMTSGLGSTGNYTSLTGIVLSSCLWDKGKFSSTWNASEFEIYNGSITLKNE